MKKHLCVLIVYNNFEHIKLCFDSIKNNTNIDFFIIENYSKNSNEIKNYFLSQNLVGYIQFIDNIAANARRIWRNDYHEFVNNYDIITISDGDLYVYDSKSMFTEILQNLQVDDVIASSADLYRGNYYKSNTRVIGIEKYKDEMKNRTIDNELSFCNTACNFITFTNKNYFKIFNKDEDKIILDNNIYASIKNNNGKWIKTVNNIIYHLTWDLYQDQNEYFIFKKEFVKNGNWRKRKTCDYNIII